MLCPDSDSRKGLFCVFLKAIGSVAGFGLAKVEPDSAKNPPLQKLFTNTFDPSPLLSGFEPTKPQNLFVISLFSGLSAFGVVLCVVTGGDENEKDDRRNMGRRDQPTG